MRQCCSKRPAHAISLFVPVDRGCRRANSGSDPGTIVYAEIVMCGTTAALGVRADAAVTQTDDQRPFAWHRVMVADGIELHVRDDSPASGEDAIVAMREAVRAALGRADIRG